MTSGEEGLIKLGYKQRSQFIWQEIKESGTYKYNGGNIEFDLSTKGYFYLPKKGSTLKDVFQTQQVIMQCLIDYGWIKPLRYNIKAKE